VWGALLAQRRDDCLKCCPLRWATDCAHGEQEVDGDQLADQPADILGGRFQLCRELLAKVLLGPEEWVIKEALPEVLEMRDRPDRPVVKEQRTALDQAVFPPRIDQSVDLCPTRIVISRHRRLILSRSARQMPDCRTRRSAAV